MDQMKMQVQASMNNLNLATAAARSPSITINTAAGGVVSEEEKKKTEEADAEAAKKAEFERNDLDPQLLEIKLMFEELDKSDWKLLNSEALLKKLKPHQDRLSDSRTSF